MRLSGNVLYPAIVIIDDTDWLTHQTDSKGLAHPLEAEQSDIPVILLCADTPGNKAPGRYVSGSVKIASAPAVSMSAARADRA